jgi:cytochrome c5
MGKLRIEQRPAHGRLARQVVLAVVLAVPVISQDAIAQRANRTGEQIVAAQCVKCHQAGEGGAPRIGDRAAWTPRLKQGLDNLVLAAIRGHGGMPARGGMADTTDAEIRNAILYMFDPAGAVASDKRQAEAAAKSAAAPPVRPGGKHATVGGIEVYLGLTTAEALRAYPKESAERTMHGGVPGGSGRYHVNISLFDARSGAAIGDAQVEVEVDEPGMTSESKKLEPMVMNEVRSFGNYFRMKPRTSYVIIVRVRMPGAPQPVEARFEHRTG